MFYSQLLSIVLELDQCLNHIFHQFPNNTAHSLVHSLARTHRRPSTDNNNNGQIRLLIHSEPGYNELVRSNLFLRYIQVSSL